MKDAFYFSHDLNARNDPKILALRSVYGMEGYGRYWVLIEMMREQADYKLMLSKYVWNALALQMQCDASAAQQFVEDCINEFNLFESDGDAFWSNSLIRRMVKKDDKKEKARKAANARWNKASSDDEDAKSCDSNADALQTHMHRNACNMQKRREEKKGEERKREEKKINHPTIGTREAGSAVDNSVAVDNFGRMDGNNDFSEGDGGGDELPSVGGVGSLSPEFVEFWNAYPRKSGKPLVLKAWDEFMEKGIPADDLIRAARKYAGRVKTDQMAEKFVKMPHNFLLEGVFKEYAPKFHDHCPYCHGEGYISVSNADGTESMAECSCKRRFDGV